MKARILPAVLPVLLSCSPAAAHAPIKGIGAFYNGLLHPVLVPAHLLALVAVGLLIGQHAPRASRVALPAFALAVALALVFTRAAPRVPPQWPLLAIALSAGLSIALAWTRERMLPILLAFGAGAAVGLDSAPSGLPAAQVSLALAGTGLGTALVVTYVGGLAAWLDRPWQKIAIRAAGSWIAASALLVLTLDLLSTASAPA